MAQESDGTSTQAIRQLADALAVAWNRHDAHAFAQCLAEDAEFTNVFGMVARGRTEIERSHATIFRTFLKDSRWTKSDIQVRYIRPDVASVDIRWELIDARDPQGNEWSPRRGVMNFIATSADGVWSIQVLHNMDVPSPERALERTEVSKC